MDPPSTGWQIQREERTVQGELEAALKQLTSTRRPVIGSGRTDRGVHATGQVAVASLPDTWQPEKLEKALSAVLPNDIWIKSVEPASPDFHPRYDAVNRTYLYHLGLSWRGPFALPPPLVLAVRQAVGCGASRVCGRNDRGRVFLQGLQKVGPAREGGPVYGTRVLVGHPGKTSGSRFGSPPTASFIIWFGIWLERWWTLQEASAPWRTSGVSSKNPRVTFGPPLPHRRQVCFSIMSHIRRSTRHQGNPRDQPRAPQGQDRLHGRSYLHRLRAGPLHLPNK